MAHVASEECSITSQN